MRPTLDKCLLKQHWRQSKPVFLASQYSEKTLSSGWEWKSRRKWPQRSIHSFPPLDKWISPPQRSRGSFFWTASCTSSGRSHIPLRKVLQVIGSTHWHCSESSPRQTSLSPFSLQRCLASFYLWPRATLSHFQLIPLLVGSSLSAAHSLHACVMHKCF